MTARFAYNQDTSNYDKTTPVLTYVFSLFSGLSRLTDEKRELRFGFHSLLSVVVWLWEVVSLLSNDCPDVTGRFRLTGLCADWPDFLSRLRLVEDSGSGEVLVTGKSSVCKPTNKKTA